MNNEHPKTTNLECSHCEHSMSGGWASIWHLWSTEAEGGEREREREARCMFGVQPP